MWREGWKYVAVLIAVFFAGVLVMRLFVNIWASVGIGAAIVVVVGGLLFLVWNSDRKAKAQREDLPPV